jgi:hypothetical protein
MQEPLLFGTNRCAPPRTAEISVFIRCRTCGTQNRFGNIPTDRINLAMFRGSNQPVKCKACHADMDTMGAFCGEQVEGEIVRLDDPEFWQQHD